MLVNWMLHSFYRLWYPIVATIGFSNPITLAFITFHNSFSATYLLFITALGYLLWRRKGWILPFMISLTWTLVGFLFFGAYWQHYGLAAALASIFTHGWLELASIFYWIYNLRKACLNCYINFENDWSSWRDFLISLRSPAKLFGIVNRDIKKTWNLITRILNMLWSKKLRRNLLLVLLLIFASALIETYITPLVISSLLR